MKAISLASSLSLSALAACSASDDREPGRTRAPAGEAAGDLVFSEPARDPASGRLESQPTPVDLASAAPGAGGEGECGLENFEIERRPAEVLLVLDRSGSMQEAPEGGDPTASKWDLTVPALSRVIEETNDGVWWGLKLFPEGSGGGACEGATISDVIHVPTAESNADAVLSAIAATTPDGDGTPTGDALLSASAHLAQVPSDRDKYIVLATDGEPSCSPSGEGQTDARPYAVGAVEQSLAGNVPVFVVGVATTKDTATAALNDMARAGGMARADPNPLATRYYLANTQDELVDALRTIAGEIASCVFPLASPPPVVDNVGVKVNGVLISRDPSRRDGWEYGAGGYREIEVHGPHCEEIQALAENRVQVIYACEGVIIR